MSLNKSKGNMYEFVTHTWNPIKGDCQHDCSYCHPAGTLIMMSDFTQKRIEDIRVNDKIIGIKKTDNMGFYKFTETTVLSLSERKSKTIKIKTHDGEIVCTPEHPLMGSSEKRNCSDWKSAKSFSPYENLRYISNISRGEYNIEQRYGYLKGIRDGDGCVFIHRNKEKKEYLGFEIVCIDNRLINRIKDEFNSILGIQLKHGIKRTCENSYGKDNPMLFTRIHKDVVLLEEKTKFRLNVDFAKGYIAGMIDTDGSVDKKGKSIRISQSKIVNKIKYDNIIECCKLLNIEYIEEKDVIRIYSDFKTRIKILFEYGIFHSEKSKRLLINSSIKGSIHSEIISIESKGIQKVFNLMTESENFIANGYIVHNCYMKKWGEQKKVRLVEKEFIDLGSNKFIFVGSSTDIFAENIPNEWLIKILNYCQNFDNKYLLQTKNPDRFYDIMKNQVFIMESIMQENFIICTTLETNRIYPSIMKYSPIIENRVHGMSKLTGFRKFITIEPIMDFDLSEFIELIKRCEPEQVNIGADSGGHKLPEPNKDKILMLIDELNKFTKVENKRNIGRLLK